MYHVSSQIHMVPHIVGVDCPSSWIHYRDSCYSAFSVPQGISWVEAEQQCMQKNTHLTSIMDEEEMQVIHNLIISHQ